MHVGFKLKMRIRKLLSLITGESFDMKYCLEPDFLEIWIVIETWSSKRKFRSMFDLCQKLTIERYFFNHFCVIVYVQKFESVLKTQSAKKVHC